MADLRDMELLAALARHGHFARAAEACGISQPAFSARIRNLETELNVPIVRRGNRFQGFTAEGEIALRWARQLLLDAEGMRQDISAVSGAVSGRLTVGVVPTAVAVVSLVPALLRKTHPDLSLEILSIPSAEIVAGLADHRLGAGVSYLYGDVPRSLRTRMLYRETYSLLAPAAMVPDGDTISWGEAAKLPLCLLTRSMQNRAIIDEAFANVGVHPTPVVETNALTASLVQVSQGVAATIVPRKLLDAFPQAEGTRLLRLIKPEIDRPMGFMTPDRSPRPPAAQIFEDALFSVV